MPRSKLTLAKAKVFDIRQHYAVVLDEREILARQTNVTSHWKNQRK